MTDQAIDLVAQQQAAQQARLTLLQRWYEARGQVAAVAKPLAAQEMTLRKEVIAIFFPNSKEGINRFPLDNGWQLEFQKKLDYQVLPDALDEFRELLEDSGLALDDLLEFKPKLILKGYKTLRELDKSKCALFDRVLAIKESSPTLDLVQKKVK